MDRDRIEKEIVKYEEEQGCLGYDDLRDLISFSLYISKIARAEALEEAAKAMMPMLRNMIDRGYAADLIRALKDKE